MLVVVCGMPRSGSTLQSNIVKRLLELNGVGERVEWSRYWQKEPENIDAYIRDERIYALKTHWLEDDILALANLYPDRVFLITSHRDPRDVAVSMMVKFDYSFNKAVKRIGEAIENIDRVSSSSARHLHQKYQLLRYDLPASVNQMAKFLELPSEYNEKIVAELNIDEAYTKSRKKKVFMEGVRRKWAFLMNRPVKFADDEMMLHPNHVSEHKGEEGVWIEKLTEDQADKIMSLFSDWIK